MVIFTNFIEIMAIIVKAISFIKFIIIDEYTIHNRTYHYNPWLISFQMKVNLLII